MIFNLFLVVLAVVAVVSSANVEVADSASLPHVEGFGQRAAQAIFAGTKLVPHRTTVNGKKSENINYASYNLLDASKMTDAKLLVTRTRPNGDCTGTVIQESAYVMDQCNFRSSTVDYIRRLTAKETEEKRELVVGGSYYKTYATQMTCATSDDEVTIKSTDYYKYGATRYDTSTCTSSYADGLTTKTVSSCDLETEYSAYTGPRMIGTHCNVEPQQMLTQRPGLYTLLYQYDDCSSSPAGYQFAPFGVCQLFMDYQDSSTVGEVDKYTKFYYIKMNSYDDDHVEVLAFSDPDCTQRLFRSHFNLNTHPLYDTCEYDVSTDLFGSMFYGTTPFAQD